MIYINIPHTISEHLNVNLWMGLFLRRNSFLIQFKIYFACFTPSNVLPGKLCLKKKVKNKKVTWSLKSENASEKKKREVNCSKYTRKALCVQKLISFSPNQCAVISTENYQRTVEYKAQKITAVITTCNCAAVSHPLPLSKVPSIRLVAMLIFLGLKDQN